MRTRPRSGTVLMEAVLCLPLLLFLVTGIVQFARIWEARLLTRHAAYNAARATLVYNPSDYATTNALGKPIFRATSGAAWLAAVNTLAWKSATHSPFGSNYRFPGFLGLPDGRIPDSAFIRQQVRIDPNASWESNGLVRVTVQFKFPLLFSLFSLGATQGDPDADSQIGSSLVHEASEDTAVLTAWSDSTPHILLKETCLLPKPWSSTRYPRVSDEEAVFMEMR